MGDEVTVVARLETGAPIPAGFSEKVRVEVATVEDLPTLGEYRDRLAAVESYLARKSEDCAEVRRAQRWVEVRIGELLGPATVGAHSSVSEGADLTANERHQFRQMAENQEAVAAVLAADDATGSRREVLGAIKGDGFTGYSSRTDEWETPQDLFDELDAEFGFTLDVCALPESAKCPRYFAPEDDGLTQDWTGTCWMNPPYGDAIGKWVEKARLSAEHDGTVVVCLVPARTDTAWWWDNCIKGEVRFLRGRLKFGGGATGAPFPSAVVVMGHRPRVVWWDRGR